MYMDVITSTEIRTKMPHVIETLLHGGTIELVHRSKIVGEIRPKKTDQKIMTKRRIQELMRLAKAMNLPKLNYKQREENYRRHMMEKYGKGLS